MSRAIGDDAPFANFGTDEAADALLKLWEDDDAQDEPSDEPEDEDNEDLSTDEDESDEDSAQDDELDESDEEDESDEDEEDDEDDTDEDDKRKRKVLKDDAVVKVKVGDTEEEVPVSKLTRLYGQEKALTQKSMEVAERRKELETLGERHVAASEALLERAQKRFEPFAKIDWNLAAQELEKDEYLALRTEAQKAYEDLKFLEQDVDSYVTEVRKQRDIERFNTAKQTIKALSDPKTGIPGFNQKLYGEILNYAVSQGMPQEAVASIVDEAPLRFLHKAMLYDKGAKAVTKKVEKKNKKIVKSKAAPEVSRPAFTKSKDKDALARLKRTGSGDDAAAALLARWAGSDD